MFFQLTWIFVCSIFGLDVLNSAGVNKQSWDYTLLSVDFANSSNEELFKWDLHVERMGRGEFGLSGTLTFNIESEKVFVEVPVYRSARGNNQYKAIPFGVARMPFQQFMDTIYREMYMTSFAACSDLPVFDASEAAVYENKVYELNKCQFLTNHFPSYVWPGYYKIYFLTSGLVDSTLEVLIKIDEKY